MSGTRAVACSLEWADLGLACLLMAGAHCWQRVWSQLTFSTGVRPGQAWGLGRTERPFEAHGYCPLASLGTDEPQVIGHESPRPAEPMLFIDGMALIGMGLATSCSYCQ